MMVQQIGGVVAVFNGPAERGFAELAAIEPNAEAGGHASPGLFARVVVPQPEVLEEQMAQASDAKKLK